MWRAVGPAVITASVVLGPGSILSASKIGYQHGYAMVWVLAFASLMMIGMMVPTALRSVSIYAHIANQAKNTGSPVAAT